MVSFAVTQLGATFSLFVGGSLGSMIWAHRFGRQPDDIVYVTRLMSTFWVLTLLSALVAVLLINGRDHQIANQSIIAINAIPLVSFGVYSGYVLARHSVVTRNIRTATRYLVATHLPGSAIGFLMIALQ